MSLAYPIRFQDADFEHRFARCWSSLEGQFLRWVPFGMPRLNSTFKNMVFFLYGRDPESGKIVGPLGTGSLIGIEAKTKPFYIHHFYAVTGAVLTPMHLGQSVPSLRTLPLG